MLSFKLLTLPEERKSTLKPYSSTTDERTFCCLLLWQYGILKREFIRRACATTRLLKRATVLMGRHICCVRSFGHESYVHLLDLILRCFPNDFQRSKLSYMEMRHQANGVAQSFSISLHLKLLSPSMPKIVYA